MASGRSQRKIPPWETGCKSVDAAGFLTQGANLEARQSERRAAGAAQNAGSAGDQHGRLAGTHDAAASSAARCCSAWAATRRALAIRVRVRPLAGMNRQLAPSATYKLGAWRSRPSGAVG